MTSGGILRIVILLAVLLPSGAMAIYALRVPSRAVFSNTERERGARAKARMEKIAEHRRLDAWKQLIAANFAGDAACAECHAEEYQAHQRSGHSHTATLMERSELAKQLLADGTYVDPLRDQQFSFSQRGDSFMVGEVGNAQLSAVPVTWLLGSGTHAQTPIAVDEATQSGVEFRWSYLAHQDAVAVTPDQTRFQQYREGTMECYGRPMGSADVRACLGCHSTLIPPAQLPVRKELVVANVGCERCHGPRKKHVIMAHQGRAAEAPPLVQYKKAETYMDACSQCHRDGDSVDPGAAPHELVRFQPYGLKRSHCYTKSADKLTCSTCHDPHDAISHDRGRYIEQCQQCHQPSTPDECPRQPRGDCIECHMPAVEWTSGIAFHDHWIRVRTDSPAERATSTD